MQYVLVFVGCVLVVDALVGDKGLLAMLKARQEYQRARAVAGRGAGRERAAARGGPPAARRIPAAIEDIARRELGLIKPGEKLFIMKDVRPAAP